MKHYVAFMIMEAFSHQRVCPFWFGPGPGLGPGPAWAGPKTGNPNYFLQFLTIL